jgi:hypothetical protein
MKRKDFIALSTLAAASICIPFLNCTGPDPELDKKLAVPETLSKLLDEKTIKEIGKAYGISTPDEYSIKKLEQQLEKDNEGKTVSPTSPAKDAYAFLEKNSQHDFESGRTVVLNGWVVSLTEARQCALLSLIPQSK